MADFMNRLANRDRGMLGTWAKIASLEMIELLGHAGFDFVVVDLEHAPLTVEAAYQMIFAAQVLGMGALVRLSDRQGSQIQRLLDSGADGLLVPHAADIEAADLIARSMVFSDDMPLAKGAWIRPDYAFTAEDLLAQLDEHGIHFAVISALSISGTYNDYLIAQLRRHKRLRGTAIVPPGTDRYTLEQMRDDGIGGIRLQLARSEQLDDDPVMRYSFAAAEVQQRSLTRRRPQT